MSTKHFKATWPRVIRSTEVEDNSMIAIDGANFEDGMRRIVVGVEVTPEVVKLIEETLRQIDYADQQRSWFETMLSASPEPAESSEWVTAPDGEEFRVGACQGHRECPVEKHEHGCYADDGSNCDHPEDHPESEGQES